MGNDVGQTFARAGLVEEQSAGLQYLGFLRKRKRQRSAFLIETYIVVAAENAAEALTMAKMDAYLCILLMQRQRKGCCFGGGVSEF